MNPPSPLMGEGYGDLAPQGLSRSWMGVMPQTPRNAAKSPPPNSD